MIGIIFNPLRIGYFSEESPHGATTTLSSMDETEFTSPELRRLEEEVKMMEAEMDAAHQELEVEFVEIQIMSNDDSNDSSPDLQLTSSDVRQSPLSLAAAATSSRVSPFNSDEHTQLPLTISYTRALTTLALWITSAPTGLCLAFSIFFFSVIAQMYPTAPQSGPFVAMLFAIFQIKSVSSSWQDKGRMTHIVSLVTIIVMTIVFDVDWLISNYIVHPVGGERSDDFEEKMMQQSSFVRQMCWWCTAMNIILKILSINDFLKIWDRLRGYITSTNNDLARSVSQKVIVTTWVEFVSALLLFVFFFIIQFDVVVSRIFMEEATVQILSVQATPLFKGTSGIFVSLSLIHHIKMRDFCGQCGRSYCCLLSDMRWQTRSRRSIIRSQKKLVSSLTHSLKCIALAKAVDFVMCLLLWISLVDVMVNVQSAPKDVTSTIFLIGVTNLFTTATLFLVGSIIWSIRSSEETTERSNESRAEGGTDTALPLHYSLGGASIHSADKKRVARSLNDDDDDAYDSNYDFDLSPINVRNSQNLFAARLHAASPTSPIRQQRTHHQHTPPPSPYGLDRNLYCNPREFEAEWQSLSGRIYEYPIIISSSMNTPSLSHCSIHFNQIGWSIIASGVINDNTVTRLFLIAQRRVVGKIMSVEESRRRRSGSNGKKNSRPHFISRCLAQLSIDAMNSLVTLEMRSRKNDDEDQIKFFVRSLELDQLLDDVMVR